MILRSKIIYLITFCILTITNLLIFFNIEKYFLREFFSILFIFVIPGFFISSLMIDKEIKTLEKIIYIPGFSISFIYLVGLIINWSLPLFSINDPLKSTYLLIGFDIALVILGLISFIFNRNHKINLSITKIDLVSSFFGLSLVFLSIFGTNLLNNNGSNILIVLLLLFTPVYFIFLVYKNKLLTDISISLGIFFIALSMLLMLSLRSWFISGFDISMEYMVFQITSVRPHWDISYFRNAYNACLSITLLPTVIANLSNIVDEYVYKFIYQLLFATIPVGIYFFVKKIINKEYGLFASFFFIIQPWFIDPMVTIARQQIAFMFFMLIVITLLNTSISAKIKNILLILFGFALVVSHYSTTYVSILIFILTYIFSLLFRLFIIDKNNFISRIFYRFNNIFKIKSFNLSIWFLIYLISITFLWYSTLTGTSNNITDFSKKTFNNLNNIFKDDLRTGIVSQVLNRNLKLDYQSYQDYVDKKTFEYKSNNSFDTYHTSTYSNFIIEPKSSKTIPIKSNIYGLVNNFYKFLLVSVQIALLIGTFFVFFIHKSTFKNITVEYKILIFVCEFALLMMILLPYVSIGYNFDRLYLHTLIVLAPVEIIGLYCLLQRIPKDIGKHIYSAYLIMIFIFSYGLIWQFIGGKTVMWLNNFGFYYDITYTHAGEKKSIEWLSLEIPNPRVHTNSSGRNKLNAYGKITNVLTDTLPSTIDKNSYVYLTYANLNEDIAFFSNKGINLVYKYPKSFMNNYKNKIYSNNSSEIYR